MTAPTDRDVERPNSMSVTVKDLAAEGKYNIKASRFPGVPVWLVVLSLVVVALGIVTLPLGIIISNSSQESLSDLSELVTRQAVDEIYNQVQTNLNQPLQFLNIVRDSTLVQKVVPSDFTTVTNETSLFSLFVTLINSTQYLTIVQCMTYPNLLAGNPTPPPGPLPNITQLLAARNSPGVFRRVFMDWTTFPMAMFSPYIPDGRWGPALPIYNLPAIVSRFPIYNYLLNTKSDKVEYVNTYTNGRLFTSAIGGVWNPSTSTSHISYACEVGFDSASALSPLLESIKVTTNTHVFLMDSVTGILLANSVPGTCYKVSNFSDPSLPTIAFTPDTTNDTNARDIGMYLKGKYGNYSLIPNLNQTVSMETKIGSTRWIINYRYLDTPNTYIVVIGIPRSDFFNNVDNAQQKALILACVLAAVGVIVTVVCAWFAMRPLHTLTLAMEKLTKMDFTALEGDILTDRSFMIEVRRLQVTFALMCKAFASGIRKNKALVSNASTPGHSARGSVSR
ncbi:hypothetical protein HDU76_001778 [Blyttiomyces sp. JEL0837]|nr:hypothetical protein HDU76_001778 [Blyttiomyces sp. JEL0837]